MQQLQGRRDGRTIAPAEVRTVVIRWLGNANFEFAYKGKVYLFDAYFDRTPRSHKLGFKAADVSKAEAIFVSHAHFDHISDIGPVARQTGAPVVGAPITAETAKKLGAPEKQIVVAKGGETHEIRRRHGRDRARAAFDHPARPHSISTPSLYKNDSPPYSEEEKTQLAHVRSLGTFDPKVITEGTLAYGLVFPSGFKAVLIGSAGPITPGVRALAEKLGPVDVAIVAYRCTRSPTRRSNTHGLSSSCSSRSFSCPRTTIGAAGLGRSRPRAAVRQDPRATCRTRPSSRRSIVRRSASPAPAPTRARSCRSSTRRVFARPKWAISARRLPLRNDCLWHFSDLTGSAGDVCS